VQPVRESEDPYCLRDGEGTALLTGHPWRRFVAVGDSLAEGIVEPLDGYASVAWVDRVAAELTTACPELVYRNLGQRDLRASQVRERQLDEAVALRPDLALIACGGNDAFPATYNPDAVDRVMTEMISALQHAGADVVTIGMFDSSYSPWIPEWLRPGLRSRFHTLASRIKALSDDLGTIHVDLTTHPANVDPSHYSKDGRHGTARSHAIGAAEAVRRLGAYLAAINAG
jgi:lysophospholipase L1-like esterase